MPSVVADINKIISRVDPTRRPHDDDEPIVKGANAVLTFLQNIRKQPVPLQIGVGGSAGVLTGYVFTKGSKLTAGFIGCSLIIFQFCNYRGYIQVNKSKLERDVARLRSSIESELFGRKSALPDQREVCLLFSAKSL
uniref:Dehydrogenase/reductase SDR family member 7B n=1 Tax=Parascaris univalens TaxID=6257 RepID=A0A914ZJ07_PARUN